MRTYMIPSTEVQVIRGAYSMQGTSTTTDHGGNQEDAQAPKRKLFYAI